MYKVSFLILLFINSAYAKKPLFDYITEFVQTKNISSIDELSSHLNSIKIPHSTITHAKNGKQSNFVYAFNYNSRSPISASLQYPKILGINASGEFAFTFSSHESMDNGSVFEVIEYDNEKKMNIFKTIDFSSYPPKIDRYANNKCAKCHGDNPENMRLIWEKYPHWPGFYGSTSQSGYDQIDYYLDDSNRDNRIPIPLFEKEAMQEHYKNKKNKRLLNSGFYMTPKEMYDKESEALYSHDSSDPDDLANSTDVRASSINTELFGTFVSYANTKKILNPIINSSNYVKYYYGFKSGYYKKISSTSDNNLEAYNLENISPLLARHRDEFITSVGYEYEYNAQIYENNGDLKSAEKIRNLKNEILIDWEKTKVSSLTGSELLYYPKMLEVLSKDFNINSAISNSFSPSSTSFRGFGRYTDMTGYILNHKLNIGYLSGRTYTSESKLGIIPSFREAFMSLKPTKPLKVIFENALNKLVNTKEDFLKIFEIDKRFIKYYSKEDLIYLGKRFSDLFDNTFSKLEGICYKEQVINIVNNKYISETLSADRESLLSKCE
jgi:hypothetical protein